MRTNDGQASAQVGGLLPAASLVRSELTNIGLAEKRVRSVFTNRRGR